MSEYENPALQLADRLDAVPETGADPELIDQAAAELRDLVAEVQRLNLYAKGADELIEVWKGRAQEFMNSRDRLLKANHSLWDRLDILRASLGQPVAWLHTATNQSFNNEPPPSLKAQCQPLYTHSQPKRAPLTESEERQAFEAWCHSAGLMQQSHGIVSISSHTDTAWLAWQAAIANRQQPQDEQEPVATPDECHHIIWFDDSDMRPMMFAGRGARDAALRAFDRVSVQWNAHLFVRIQKNSRDDQYPCAPLYTNPQPQREPLTREKIRAIQHELSDTVGCSYETMARAVEAAHNIGSKA